MLSILSILFCGVVTYIRMRLPLISISTVLIIITKVYIYIYMSKSCILVVATVIDNAL